MSVNLLEPTWEEITREPEERFNIEKFLKRHLNNQERDYAYIRGLAQAQQPARAQRTVEAQPIQADQARDHIRRRRPLPAVLNMSLANNYSGTTFTTAAGTYV